MKKYGSLPVCFLFLFTLILQACSLPNQPYIRKDASEPLLLKVARYETPPFRIYSTGSMITTIITSGIFLGGLGAAIGYGVYNGLSRESDDPKRPDFGKLVMDALIERAQNELPAWSNVIVEDKIITEPLRDKSRNVLEIKVDDIRVEITSNTLITSTMITMKDTDNNILWQKTYDYDSSLYQRFNTVDALKADDYKILKAEYIFAVNKTVDDFIAHFNNSAHVETSPQVKSIPVVIKPTVPLTEPDQQVKSTSLVIKSSLPSNEIAPQLKSEPVVIKLRVPSTGTDQQVISTPVVIKPVVPSIKADPRYSKIKAIKLVNGKIIEGQIISMNAQVLKILTKDGDILSFSFIGEVNQFISE